MASICNRLLAAEGFSNGWAELALKKPPPLVPSILMANCEATGPMASVWVVCVAGAVTGAPFVSSMGCPAASSVGAS